MNNAIKLIIVLLMITSSAFAQKNITKNGRIRFYSETPMEKIEAINTQVNSALDISTGDFVFKVLIKSFEFERALMQEHFNENYVESDKFPQAVLKATVSNKSSININKPGKQDVILQADITIHGVTKNMEIKGTCENVGGKLVAQATFILKPSDFNIQIPKAVADNIAKEIEVTVNFETEPFNK